MTVEEGWSELSTIALQTTGCKLNQAETEALTHEFLEAGYQVVAPEHAADIYLLNTCTITHLADRKCRNLLRSARRRNPNALIVATGCYAERAPAELQKIEEADLIIDNKRKDQLINIIEAAAKSRENGNSSQPIPSRSPILRTRAFVKIQEGCNHGCSFCIVPSVRGRETSCPSEDIVNEVNARVAEGYKEVILTGTRIGRYGHSEGLQGLVKRILKECDLSRLRLSSLEPADLTTEALALWKNKRLCPHIHMSLQSGSDSVLERMGRSYSTTEYLQAISRAREAIPNLAVTTDIIVGFPGESDNEFNESFDFCKHMGFAKIHVFPYSKRPGTKASLMKDNVTDQEKKHRTKLMLDLSQASSHHFHKQFLGHNMDVLWEENKNGLWYGLTDNYIRVFHNTKGSFSNQLLTTNMVNLQDDGLYGELITQGRKSEGVRGS